MYRGVCGDGVMAGMLLCWHAMRLVALLALSRVLCDLGGRYRFVFYSQLRREEGREEGFW